MTNDETIFDNIQQAFGNTLPKLNIMQEEIDINLQMEYFEMINKYRKKINSKKLIQNSEQLFTNDISNKEKQKLLIKLAGIDKPEVFRILERYAAKCEKTMRPWAKLALNENRMVLESSLLDENQIFISTGLGGKDNKLRYFIVLQSKGEKFNDYQKKIIKSELNTHIKKVGGEIEKILFPATYATVKTLLPLNANLKNIFTKLVSEANEYGNFIKTDYLITNVKTLTTKEINKIITKSSDNYNLPQN